MKILKFNGNVVVFFFPPHYNTLALADLDSSYSFSAASLLSPIKHRITCQTKKGGLK